MRLSRRGPEVPAHVRAAVSGRVLAAAQAGDGRWLAGTRDVFHVVGEPPVGEDAVAVDAADDVAWPWEQVQRADWDTDASTLRVERVADYGQPMTLSSFVLDDPGLLLELIRERVTASVVVERRVNLARRRGFSVIGRRAPSGGGGVTWAYQFDPEVDPEDPAVTSAAEAALREARESLGL